MKFILLSVCLVFLNLISGKSQDENNMTLSLDQVIQMAKGNTPDMALAKTRLSNNYWRFQSYRSELKPQLAVTGTTPNLDRTISQITQPDGSEEFIRRSLNTSSVQVSLNQNIGLTGGQVFASSGLSRIDLISSTGNQSSYLSNPISIGISQPLFSFNQFKWDKIIQPLAYEEAQREYSEELEEKALEATTLFFDIFVAQITLEASRIDKANADTLYNISVGRYNVGKIAENELLQMELSMNQSEVGVSEALLDLQNSTENLRIFLGLPENTTFSLLSPTDIPEYEIDPQVAIETARKNRKVILEFERRVLEADMDVARARGESGFNANLFASFGLSGTADDLPGAYKDPLDSERFNLGFEIPIADWGKSKARRKIAESNKDLVQLTVDQERVNFEQDILIKIQQFELVRNRLRLAEKSFEIAKKRYDITRKRYRIGKIDVTELNIALQEQTSARQAYMQSLRAFWFSHFEIRRLTLYDFVNDIALPITTEE